MNGIRRSAGWLAALVAATTALACYDEPRTAKSLAPHMPARQVVHAELHRRQLLTELAAIRASVKAADQLPTLCRLSQGRLSQGRLSQGRLSQGRLGAGREAADERALPVTRRMLRALVEPGVEVPDFDAQLNDRAFAVLAESAHGIADHDRVMAAIDRINDHRFLAVVQPQRHRAPVRRGDRTVTPGRLEGEVILIDAESHEPLCRGDVEATTSSSVNAYGDIDAEAFAQDLGVNFLRAVEEQLRRATGGMKLAWDEASPRLASHGASSPSADPP